MSPVSFVLVHGAFGNAAQWGPLVRALVSRGHRVLPVELPGHGFEARPGGMVGLSTSDEVEAVLAAVRAVRAQDPVVLVGHSRGGLAVTATVNAVPELIDHAVYVSAWCCVSGGPSSYAMPQPSAFDELIPTLLLADPAEVGELRVDLAAAAEPALETLHQALLAEGTRSELFALLSSMDHRESIHVDDAAVRVAADRWGRVARTYVRLSSDRALLPALQDRFIAEADEATPQAPFTVVDLAASHFGVLLHPEPLADALSSLDVRR